MKVDDVIKIWMPDDICGVFPPVGHWSSQAGTLYDHNVPPILSIKQRM